MKYLYKKNTLMLLLLRTAFRVENSKKKLFFSRLWFG